MNKGHDFDAIKKELVFLKDNQADTDYNSRVRKHRASFRTIVSKAQGKVNEFKDEAESYGMPIELEYSFYVEWANDYIYKRHKDALPNLPIYPLNSGYFKSKVRKSGECKTALGEVFDIKDVYNECLIVKPIYLNDEEVEYEYMPFTSNVKEIKERFEGFTADDLLYGEYFIYFPKHALDWLIAFKGRYDFYVEERDRVAAVLEELEDVIKEVEEG